MQVGGEEQVLYLLRDMSKKMPNLKQPLMDFGERVRRRISQRLSGAVLKERTARLKGSLDVTPDNKSVVISAGGRSLRGDAVRYAGIHDKGGTIRPKTKKFLTIPFPGGPADTRTPKRAADFKNTFIAKGIIFQKIGKKEIRPLFILKKQVKIPARPYLFFEDSDINYLRKSIQDYIMGRW
jgi:phage gpG-like protein